MPFRISYTKYEPVIRLKHFNVMAKSKVYIPSHVSDLELLEHAGLVANVELSFLAFLIEYGSCDISAQYLIVKISPGKLC